MRNDSCVFANYCDAYDLDHCQGCARASESISIEREATWLGNWKLSQTTNGYRLAYARSDNSTKKEADMTIKQVYFNEPVTVVIWADGTKTIVKCQEGDTYSKETGLAVAIAKKALGNKGNFNEVFKKWIPEYRKDTSNVEESAVGYVYFKDDTKEPIIHCSGTGTDDFKFRTERAVYRAMKITTISTDGITCRVWYRHYLKCSKTPASINTIDTIDHIELEEGVFPE